MWPISVAILIWCLSLIMLYPQGFAASWGMLKGKISKSLSTARYTFAKVWASIPWDASTTKTAPSQAAKLLETS